MSKVYLLVTDDRRDEVQLRRLLHLASTDACIVTVSARGARRALDLVIPDELWVRIEPATPLDAKWLATLVEVGQAPTRALVRGSAAARLAAGTALASGLSSVVRLDARDAASLREELLAAPQSCTPQVVAVG